MDNLKGLTAEEHKNAERQAFVKKLFKKELCEKDYATFLRNQHAIYDTLEAIAMMHGLFNDVPELRRAPKILEDFQELWKEDEPPALSITAVNYGKYILSIKDDVDKIMAHVYVRHMGDLSGGQMLAKCVPGSGRMYEFDCDIDELKSKVRSKLDDSMADEAKVCFNWATELFKELDQ